MSSGPYSRRFDPSRRFPAIREDWAALLRALETSSRSEGEEATVDLDRRDVDEALEQIDLEGCRVCPSCGAIVARDGSVLD